MWSRFIQPAASLALAVGWLPLSTPRHSNSVTAVTHSTSLLAGMKSLDCAEPAALIHGRGRALPIGGPQSGTSSGQTSSSPPASVQNASVKPPPLNGIAHLAIRVHDLATSTMFYEKLGFVRAFELSRDGAVYEAFIKINDQQFIELYSVSEKEPQVGFLHVCFEGADLHAIHDDYVSQGLSPISVRKAGAGNLLFTVLGPAQPAFAQNLEYTQYLPGSLHTDDLGKHLGQDRVADRIASVSLAMVDPAAARRFYEDKLHFLPLAQGTLLGLPGTSNQTIAIVPDELGLKASFTLRTGDLHRASERIKGEGIAMQQAARRISIADPDGNLLVISDQPFAGR